MLVVFQRQKTDTVLIICVTGLLVLSGCSAPGFTRSGYTDEPVFYKPASTGSDSLYNPLYSNVSYSLDTLQLANNFNTDDFSEHLEDVWYHLQHPTKTIEGDGGSTRFINREVFPIDSDRSGESAAMLPNYMLHLLGGGILYRKDMEWFRSRQYRYPRFTAAALAMTSELVQEAIENDNATDSDAIADLYLFRPIGLLLFSNDRLARYIKRVLEPAVWSTLQSWDAVDKNFTNTGISYIYRPPLFTFGDMRAFIFTGLNNLFGLSHALQSGGTLSWGVGVAISEITDQKKVRANLKTSVGLFYDRGNNLVWSAVFNDVGITRFRMNFYPYGSAFPGSAGFFLSLSDFNEISAGMVYRLPLGVAMSN